MSERVSLLSMSPEELESFLGALGEGRYRAGQISKWLTRGVDFDGMSDLPKPLRAKLGELCVSNPVRIIESVRSRVDDTRKFLYGLEDGNIIEGVLMRYHHGDTLCLSTQVGCRMGCAFCASTLEGCVRNLDAGELLGQIIRVNALIEREGAPERVHNVVLMGSGEPLDNYDNVVTFLRRLNDPSGLNLSLRNVSVSTCGLVDKMRALADEGLPVTLSVSLHAPNDDIRRRLMPVAHAYQMSDVLAACRYYIEKTGRRVIFEYALIKDVNCLARHADELALKLRGMQCHVNIIPLNDVKERELYAPDAWQVAQFIRRLEQNHISVTRRREMGDDIQGACGQLRRSRVQTDA